MGPEDLATIRADTDHVVANADHFTAVFYSTVFDLAPSVRAMFPRDMAEQRRKLLIELTELTHIATGMGNGETERFADRAQALGRRHSAYGVTGDHYTIVGTALVAALANVVPDWDDRHEHTWNTLYRLVADTMRSGSTAAAPTAGKDTRYTR